jgi:hypothetical protein
MPFFRGRRTLRAVEAVSHHPTVGSFDPRDDFYPQHPLSALFTKGLVESSAGATATARGSCWGWRGFFASKVGPSCQPAAPALPPCCAPVAAGARREPLRRGEGPPAALGQDSRFSPTGGCASGVPIAPVRACRTGFRRASEPSRDPALGAWRTTTGGAGFGRGCPRPDRLGSFASSPSHRSRPYASMSSNVTPSTPAAPLLALQQAYAYASTSARYTLSYSA